MLSNTTAELIQDDLPSGVSLRDLGDQQLKDIDRPERLYQLVADGLASEFPPLRTASPKRPRRRLAVGAAAGVAAVVAAAVAVIVGTRGGSAPAASAAPVSADSVGTFNSANGRLTGQVSVGASPSAIAAGDGSIWVTNVDAHTVSRVDPVKQVVIQTIQVGNGPDGIAVGGGFVWVTNGLDGTVTKISPITDSPVDTIQVGNGPAGVATGARYVWVANSNDGTVTRIDERTDKPLAPINVGQSADGIAVEDGSVWVTSNVSGTVTRIDATGNVAQSVATGDGADAVAAAPDSIWVANNLDGTVTRVDPTSSKGPVTIAVGDGPSGIAVAGSAVWVSNELAGTLSRIDAVRNAVVQTVTTGNRPEGVVVSSGQLFVPVRASGTGHRGGTLTMLTTADGGFGSDDPVLTAGPIQGQVFALTNDGLTGFRRAGGSAGTRLVPDLAVSLPSPTDAGRSYTFQLRPGIRYSTGALVRPQDFRSTIERTLDLLPGLSSYYGRIVGARRCLADAKRPCDLSKGIVTDAASNTVTFHLTAPDPNFLSELALPYVYVMPAGTPLHPHGPLPATGPYEIAPGQNARGIRLIRNPRFHEWSHAAQPSGFPNVIVERYRGSPDAHVSAVLHGAADLVSDVAPPSPSVLASVRTQHPSQLEINPWDITLLLALNTRLAPFDDVRARRALNFAVDREHLRDLTVGQGLGKVTCQVLPPDFDGYRRYCPYTAAPTKTGAWTAPDLARARQLVRASGTVGQAVTVWMPSFIPFSTAAGRYVVSVLDTLGYKARLRAPRFNPFLRENKLHVQLGFWGWGPDFAATPAGFIPPAFACSAYTPVTSQNQAVAEFCDPAIDREMARAQSLQASDPEAASQLWAKIDRDVTDQAPWVPFANGVVLEVVSKRVGNYQYNPQYGTLLDQLWVR